MINSVHARTMAVYNRWMNQRLYELCAGLSDEERKRDRGWKGPADELYADFGELRSARAALDRLIEDWSGQLEERTSPAWILVTHMFNHQTHHRGDAAVAARHRSGCD